VVGAMRACLVAAWERRLIREAMNPPGMGGVRENVHEWGGYEVRRVRQDTDKRVRLRFAHPYYYCFILSGFCPSFVHPSSLDST